MPEVNFVLDEVVEQEALVFIFILQKLRNDAFQKGSLCRIHSKILLFTIALSESTCASEKLGL